MNWIFIISAVLGGTVLVCQLVLLLAGLSGHGDLAGEDAGGDVGHELSADHGGDHAAPAAKELPPAAHALPSLGPSLLVCMLGLRGIVAGVAFFGLGGIIAEQGGAGMLLTILTAVLLGILAMALVGFFTRTLYRMRVEGTLNISGAVGKHGTVYLSIPARKTGVGKVTVELQNRTAEYPAITAFPEDLATGSAVTVIALAEKDTLEVIPASFDRKPAE